MLYSRFDIPRAVLALIVVLFFASAINAQTSAFTYQGRLTDTSMPATGTYQMQFALYDAVAGGTQIGGTVEITSVTTTNGVFTVDLDFGAAAFPGGDRYLEIRVRRLSSDPYTVLSPRKRVTSVPMAVQALSAGPDPRLKLLGAMRWDQLKASTFHPLTGISGIAFDGTDLWVSRTNNTVSKMRTSDLATLGTYTVGTDPRGMASDGANIWVANFGSNTVTKLRASDGAVQGTFPVGTNPIAIAFDGTNIWVANNGSSNLTKLRGSTGALLFTVGVASNPNSILFDGTFIWAGGSGGISRFHVASPSIFFVDYPVNGIAFDGSHIWTSPSGADMGSSNKLAPDEFATLLDSVNVGPNGNSIVYDGRSIWLAAAGPFRLQRFSPTSNGGGQRPSTYSVQGIPRAMTFDGSNIWLATHLGLARYPSSP